MSPLWRHLKCRHPSHALSDISGIKKQYMRKHFKWKCGNCERMYAYESDLKLHSNNCHLTVCTCKRGDEFSSNDDCLTHRKCCYMALLENPWPFFPTGGTSLDGGTRGGDQNEQPAPGWKAEFFYNVMPDDLEDFLRVVPEGLEKVVNSPSSLGMLSRLVDHGRGASLQSPRLGVGPSMSTSPPGVLQGSGAHGSSSAKRREEVPATAVPDQVMETGADGLPDDG